MDTDAAPPALARLREPCADAQLELAAYGPYIMAAIHFRQQEMRDRVGQTEVATHPLPLDLGRFMAVVAEFEAQRCAVPPEKSVG